MEEKCIDAKLNMTLRNDGKIDIQESQGESDK